MTGMIITTRRPDIALLTDIHTASFAKPWSENAIKGMTTATGSMTFVEEDGQGFGIIRRAADEAEILTLCVRPAARGKRIGANLVLTMIDWSKSNNVKSLFLEVREGNTAALSLYEKAGFARISLRKDYYRNDDGTAEHAVIMRKVL